jgi:hypothetical protein
MIPIVLVWIVILPFLAFKSVRKSIFGGVP